MGWGLRALSATAAVATATAVLTLPGTAQAATPSEEPCQAIRDARGTYIQGAPLAPLTTGVVTIMGQRRAVNMATLRAASGRAWGTDPSKLMWFRSLYWLASAAIEADEQGRSDLLDHVSALVARYHSLSPDPGGADSERAYEAGWDEGTVTRRQQAVNCIYALTPSPSTAKALRQLSQANLDNVRYMGPPQRPPHNHGLMANQALWTTGELLGDGTLVRRATGRLSNDFRASFTDKGVTIEGSTVYQFFLYPEWRRVAQRLDRSGARTAATVMQRRLTGVFAASRHMIRPDGAILPLGDGFPALNPNRPDTDPRTPLVLADPEALFAARFAWNDPRSAFATLRLGTDRGSHGHDDLGSLTWSAKGIPVLVDAGSFNYATSPVNTWLKSRAAHNVPTVAGWNPGTTRSGYTARLLSHRQNRTEGSVSALLRAGSKATAIKRTINYTATGQLTVTDAGKNLRTQQFTLDPRFTGVRWRADHRRVTITSPSGGTVVVTAAKGNTLSTVRGRQSPRAGWVAPKWETLVPALQVRNEGRGTLSVTMRVTP